jgi:predicted DNA-binding protein with PD1-like motif
MSQEKQERTGRYKIVECERGREWIFRVSTGDDVYLAAEQFAKDHDIRFAKIHAAVMGGLEPAKYMVWAHDARDPENWRYEAEARLDNLTMVLSMSGIIHLRRNSDGELEPFPAIHFVTGGAWDAPTVGGHLCEGTIAKGNVTFFITEILGIDTVIPPEWEKSKAPEAWYVETK